MRRELAAGTRLLIGIALLTGCGDGEPETDGEGGVSPSGDGDDAGDGDEEGGATTNSDFVVEGGFVLCGNALDCPDSSQECRKEAGERVGYCHECEDNDDCGGEQFCAMGQCADSLCEPGAPTCADTNVVANCNEDGTGFVDLEACETGTCALVDGEAACQAGNEPSGAGGSSSGGNSGGGTTATGGSPASMPGPNLITNGDFSSGADFWDGGTPVVEGRACVSWETTIGWNNNSAGTTLEAGEYTLSFDAQSSGAEVLVKVGGVSAATDFEPTLLERTMTASSQTYSFDFSVGSSESQIGLAFTVQGSGNEFCIDNVSLRKN